MAVRVVVIAGTALMGACAEPAHDRNEHYVFVATNINLPYWKEAEAGFLDGAKTLGVSAELVGPAAYSPSAELQAFRQVVEQHPAGKQRRSHDRPVAKSEKGNLLPQVALRRCRCG